MHIEKETETKKFKYICNVFMSRKIITESRQTKYFFVYDIMFIVMIS